MADRVIRLVSVTGAQVIVPAIFSPVSSLIFWRRASLANTWLNTSAIWDAREREEYVFSSPFSVTTSVAEEVYCG